MISIIDYGLGNIQAVINIYKRLGIPIRRVSTSEELKTANRILLPGVGAFDHAINRLNASGMREMLDELVLERKVPVLGICVGMQMMANASEEGNLPGLGWIDAEVNKFDGNHLIHATHLPHMGWNDVISFKQHDLFKGFDTNPQFYFLHSYYINCKQKEDIMATTDYGGEFASAVNSSNIYGVQFHPEKSHQFGIQLLKNFSTL